MRIHLFRLSLTPKQADLFSPVVNRKTYLKDSFERDFQFDHRKGIKLRYQHTQTDRNLICGAVCRWISEDVEGDPTDPFALTVGGHWAKAPFYFNIGNDEQVFGIEHDAEVGKPSAVVKAIVETVNAMNPSAPFKIDAYSVNITNSFKEAVLSYPGPITSLTFDLILPNPTNGEGKTKEALRKLKKKTNSDRLKATVSSDEGIKVNKAFVRNVASYAESGGGDIAAKSGTEKVYDSKKSAKVIEIEEKFRPDGTEIDGLSNSISDKLER